MAALLRADGGLMLVSQGEVFIRSLEGDNYAAGGLDNDGGIQTESEFPGDVHGAIEHFIRERDERGHGDNWAVE